MRTLNPTEEGIIAYAMVNGLLRLLIEKGILDRKAAADLIRSLASDLSRDYRSSAQLVPEFMRQLAATYEQAERKT